MSTPSDIVNGVRGQTYIDAVCCDRCHRVVPTVTLTTDYRAPGYLFCRAGCGGAVPIPMQPSEEQRLYVRDEEDIPEDDDA